MNRCGESVKCIDAYSCPEGFADADEGWCEATRKACQKSISVDSRQTEQRWVHQIFFSEMGRMIVPPRIQKTHNGYFPSSE